MKIKSLLSIFFLAFALSSCSAAVRKIDHQTAVGAWDLTSLLSGCGQNQIGIGYLICRLPEQTRIADVSIEIHAPPNLECDDKNSCVHFKIFYPDGRPTYAGAIPKGESYLSIPWSQLLDKEVLDLKDRGFYGVSVVIHYKGPQGITLKSYSNGYIFLHAVRREYVLLSDSGGEDENFVWKWKTKTNQLVKMTTGARVFVSQK